MSTLLRIRFALCWALVSAACRPFSGKIPFSWMHHNPANDSFPSFPSPLCLPTFLFAPRPQGKPWPFTPHPFSLLLDLRSTPLHSTDDASVLLHRYNPERSLAKLFGESARPLRFQWRFLRGVFLTFPTCGAYAGALQKQCRRKRRG